MKPKKDILLRKKDKKMEKFLLIFFFITPMLFAQNKQINDSLDLDYSLKFKVLENSHKEITRNELKKIDSIIINNNLFKIENVSSKGFKNFEFFKITVKTEIKDFFENYLIGYQKDGKIFYRLNGFLNNDFYYLYKFETRINNNSPVNLESKKNKQLFLKNHFIEGIDLECLIKNLNIKESWKIPCLDPSQKLIIDDYGEEHFR